ACAINAQLNEANIYLMTVFNRSKRWRFVWCFVCLFDTLDSIPNFRKDFLFFDTGFHCVALAVLELTLDQIGLELRDPP
ncbi:hypothetical protein ACQP3F_34330, partial [Escherichia coli]